ncbi:MAG: LysR family transcriptional regulator [Actinobacteria bacterium]|nr:LysR family transcriptional regulator [Actinomycetota bacterium]MBV8479250.1 LysR family transcriptional regulator [Actinomycetota bacterium]
MNKPDGFLGIELRHLAALDAVGRTHSFGRAARELGYTQSAVSQQIAQLERVVGQRLVERPGGPRPVSLTEAGELLLRHADAIVAQLDAAQADMAALAEGAAGPLRVGILQSVGARILPALLRNFRRDWPRVDVQLREETDIAQLLALVERGELDLTFADLPLPDGPFESAEVLRDPYVLLVSSESELAGRDEPVPLRALNGMPLIGWRSTDEPDRYLRGHLTDLNVIFRTDDNGTLMALVAEGLGNAVVPQLVVNPPNPALVTLPLGGRLPPRSLVIVWHRDRYRSAAAQAFVELAKELGAEYMDRQAP